MSQFNLETRARPILKWAGGKSGVLPQMVSHFPVNFKTYLEPFFGAGALFFSLRKHSEAILSDHNHELINLHLMVKNHPQELMVELDKLSKEYSEEFYYKLRSFLPSCPLQMAARTVFLNKTGYNGLYRQNSKGCFNVPFGKRVKCPPLYERENFLAVSERLQNVRLLNQDFEETLREANLGDFVYCDPPYEPISQTSSFNLYTSSGFSREDQERLMIACQKAMQRGVSVAISNSAAPFILKLYEGFEIRRIRAKRFINSKGHARGEIDEALILMYPRH